MLVQYIAERINEDAMGIEHIIDEKYDFMYSHQDARQFNQILAIDEELGRNSFDVTEWHGYKLYHNTDARLDNTFYFSCPSGNIFFFTMYFNKLK